MFNIVNKKNLNEKIASQILERILDGSLKQGEKLPPERVLADQMDVNRNTLREALRKLEMLGLLSIRQGDGIYIKDFMECGNLELVKFMAYTGKEYFAGILKSILEIRSLIIPEMAGKSAENISRVELELLESILSDTGKTVLEKDLALHQVIARASGNIFYSFLLNFFNDIFRDYGYIYFSNEQNSIQSSSFHKKILKKLKSGDSSACHNLMHEILVYSENRINKYLEIHHEKMHI